MKTDEVCSTGTRVESWIFGYDDDGVRTTTTYIVGENTSVTSYFTSSMLSAGFGDIYEMRGDGSIRKYYASAGGTFATLAPGARAGVRTYDPGTQAWSMNYSLIDHWVL